MVKLSSLARLKWASRRGMLELDVLLGNFLEERYPQAEMADKALFESLLNHSDPEIYAWIMGHETPPEAGMQKITEAIRQHARSRVYT